MIVRPNVKLLDVLFATRGSILPRIMRPMLLIMTISVVAVLLVGYGLINLSSLSAMPFTLVGLSLSIFMSFRNTACYDRWWEARKLWGQLLIACRSVARQVAYLPPADRARLLEGLCGFTKGLAAVLRGSDELAALEQHLEPGDWSQAPNPTQAALSLIGRDCLALMASGMIEPIMYSVIEIQLTEIALVQGSCERIKNTPLPFSYSLLLHRTAYAFCLLLPVALAPTLGWWTLLPTFLVSYAFFGLDALSDELSDPFGLKQNCLPLDSMVRTAERELLYAAGHRDLPPALRPTDYVLL